MIFLKAGETPSASEDSVDTDYHKNVFPIPFDAITASNGSLTQNDGY